MVIGSPLNFLMVKVLPFSGDLLPVGDLDPASRPAAIASTMG
jgi:hypothetical protein